MSTNNFLKGINTKKFFDGYVPFLKPITYCVVIVYENGHLYEKYGIENPWAYMKEVNKNPLVKTSYIKQT